MEQKCLCFRTAAAVLQSFAFLRPARGGGGARRCRRKIRFSLLDASRVREDDDDVRVMTEGEGIELITTRLPPAAADA